MNQIWFLPLTLLVGIAGFRTSLHARKVNPKDHGWWLMQAIGWFPLLCWLLSRVVAQD